jgi:polysaccharide biosynthesis protein PelC
VLPFVNETDYPLANSIAYKVFLAEFSTLGNYLVAQEGDVLKVYQQLRLLPGETPAPEQLGVLGSRLGVQLLITGRVLEMRENPGEHASVNPVLAVSVRLHEGPTGEGLWSTYHRREGTEYRKAMHFGKIHTVTGLSRQVAREIIQLWIQRGLTPCDVSPRF